MLIEAMQQEPAWPFTAFTACPRACGKLSPLTWQGHRGTQITQEVSLSALWWREGPGGGGAEPLWLVSLSPVKQKHLLSVCPRSAGTHQEIPNKALARRSSESPPAPRAAGTIPLTRLGWELQAANHRSSPCFGCRASARAGDGSELSWEGFPQALRPPAPATVFTLAL